MKRLKAALITTALMAATCGGLAGSADASTSFGSGDTTAAQVATGLATQKTAAATYYDFEIHVKTRYSDKIKIKGYNQHNDYVISPWVNSPNDWTKVKGWWWNGTVEIVGYQNSNGKYRTMQCTMPFYDDTNQQYCDGWSEL